MKITLPIAEAFRLAKLLKPVINNKVALPVLSQILFDLDAEGALRVSATNMDATVVAPVLEHCIDDRGTDAIPYVAVPFAAFMEACRTADKDTFLTLERTHAEQTDLSRTSKGTLFKDTLKTRPLWDFPTLKIQGFTQGFWMGKTLVAKIKAAIPFMSTDETRYILNGVHLDSERHTVVATDGRRLYVNAAGVQIPHSLVIPTAAAKYLTTHLTEGPCWLKMEGKEDYQRVVSLLIKMDHGALFMAKTHDGYFPNYKQVMPDIAGAACGTLDTVKQENIISLLLSVKSKSEILTELLFTGGEVHWRLSGQMVNKSRQWPDWTPRSLSGKAVQTGEPIKVALNPGFLGDALQAAGPGAQIWMIDSISPIQVTSADASLRIVVMPMRDSTPDVSVKTGGGAVVSSQ
jgi:DNA polymerase III sliding clamp (beta) subunit (PCNA family)